MSILVTGGARSGKSGFAERLTKKLADPQQAVYVATGQAFDEEMKARIALHRQQREEGASAGRLWRSRLNCRRCSGGCPAAAAVSQSWWTA